MKKTPYNDNKNIFNYFQSTKYIEKVKGPNPIDLIQEPKR